MGEMLGDLTGDDVLKLLSSSEQVNFNIESIHELNDASALFYESRILINKKRHFRIKTVDDECYHLSFGFINPNAWYQLNYAFSNLRSMICQPISFGNLGDYSFLIQEYFDGIPIDHALEQNIISEKDVVNTLSSISGVLDKLVTKSSREKIHQELQLVRKDIENILVFSDVDMTIIDYIFNCLEKEINKEEAFFERWTPGDLAGRNILISKNSKFKLIDFEWGGISHFYSQDWIRLYIFSNQALRGNLFVGNQKKKLKKFDHMFFWLKQLVLDNTKYKNTDQRKYINSNLGHALLSLYRLENGENNVNYSWFLESCAERLENLERFQFVNSFLHKTNETDIINFKSKINRMQESFSWKVTAPLRFLRRRFLDCHKLERRGQYCVSKKHYRNWIRKFDKLGFLKKRAYRHKIKSFDYQPLVSIILPVFDPEKCFLDQTLSSVFNQLYQNWELCICNDGSKNPQIQSAIDEIVLKDDRIKYVTLNSNMHISHSSNRAVDLAKGDYLTFLDHDDLLRPHSLYKFIERLNKNSELKFVYSDEDKIDELNQRYDHYFKPDWNPDLLLSQNYICHMVFCRTQDFREVGGFREGFEGSQDWDLFLRITEKLKTEEIGHVPGVLYHWRSTKNSTATSLSTKNYVIPRSLRSVNDALKRRKVNATATVADRTNGYLRVHFHIPKKTPRVSILIPTKDHFELITRCVESILSKTHYSNYELILLDNDTTCKRTLQYFSKIESINNISIRKISCPFNYSYINNLGVESSSGDVLAFVNNDIEAISEDWLGEMVSHAVRPEIGCVGSKLLYPDNHIQHAGVVLGIGGIAGHGQKHFPSWNDGYKHRLKIVQNYEVVTAACMLVEKKIFQKVGGFDEENLKIAYNDVDLCIKVREEGYLNLWTPYALLMHHESASRGFDKDPVGKARFAKEKEYMKKRWGHKLISDPSYNPNLSLKHEDFSLNYRPYKNLEY